MVSYNGGGSPGGVAHAYKVLELTLPLLDPRQPPERRAITIETAFGGPGGRDAFELVTRAVSERRFTVDPTLIRPQDGRARERFVFRLRYRDHSVTVALRDGFVSEAFIDLARLENPSTSERHRLTAMKGDMAAAVMAADAGDVYEVTSEV